MQGLTSWPAEIECRTLEGGGTAYRFPRRKLGRVRLLGLPLILFGCAASAFVVFWTWGFANAFQQGFGPWGLLVSLLGLPGLLAAAGISGVGSALLWGWAELKVLDGRLTVIEHVGPFQWRRRIRTGQIRSLAVACGTGSSAVLPGDVETTDLPSAGHTGGLSRLGALLARLDSGKSRCLVIGYPSDWLHAVATYLAQEIEVNAPEIQQIPVQLMEISNSLSTGRPVAPLDRWDAPADTRIQRQEIPGGFTFIVPARGVVQGSNGLFAFSLFWCGFMTVFTAFMVVSLFDGNPPEGPIWGVGLFIGSFWLVGIGMLLAAINMGRRQAALAVSGNVLKTIQSGLFGVSRQEWLLDDLQTITVGPSGIEVNDVPVMQLHIVPCTGKKVGLLTGRDDDELAWIATHLRSVLPVSSVVKADPASPGESSPMAGVPETTPVTRTLKTPHLHS